MPRTPEPDPVEWVREHWAAEGLPDGERFATVASLLRAHQVVVGGLEAALRPHGLSRTTYLVLVTLRLSPDGRRKLSYLARYLMVHPTTVTQLVDGLEGKGLARRVPHPTDRRTTLAELTAKGRRLTDAATQDAAAAGFGLGDVPDRAVAALARDLRAVRRATGDLP
jgi:DNA-binding MarR family transcriptional regulator